MAETNISNLLDVTMDKLRTVVDSDTIIGNQINVGDITIIPIVSVNDVKSNIVKLNLFFL